jgi:hydroxyethylthiazole kinase
MPAEESEMRTAATASAPSTLDWPDKAASLIERLRVQPTRVHAITNAAAQVLTANLLLAAGGIPSLTTAPDEAPSFTARAGALLVNLGTLDADRRAAIPWAVATARAHGKPWVLDPVFVDASPPRLELARLCLAGHPYVVRCNRAEFAALSGEEASPESVAGFARKLQSVVALTGPVDWVTDGETFLRIENGHPLMTRVTAMGCAATALIAAFAALEADALAAAAGALLAMGIAGEIAAEAAQGPGTFQPAFLDALAALTPDIVRRRARIA